MILYNETLLRSFLAHIQANARQLAVLNFEREAHPGAAGNPRMSRTPEIAKEWETIRRDIVLVLGPEAALKPWGSLAAKGSFAMEEQIAGRDPFRVTMGVFKARCDKARRKNPEITLMQSWDLAAKAMPYERHCEICAICGNPVAADCPVGAAKRRREDDLKYT